MNRLFHFLFTILSTLLNETPKKAFFNYSQIFVYLNIYYIKLLHILCASDVELTFLNI